MKKRVTVILDNARCIDTEDSGWLGSHDELFFTSVVRTSREVEINATKKVSIDNGETKKIPRGNIFQKDAVTEEDGPVRIRVQAWDEDVQKEFSDLAGLIDAAQKKAEEEIVTGGSGEEGATASYFAIISEGLQKIGEADKNDLLGSLDVSIDPFEVGDGIHEREWKFRKSGPTGFSSWNYVVKYRINVRIGGRM